MPSYFDPSRLPPTEEHIDYSDIIERHQVESELHYNTIVVVDGLPVVKGEKVEKLLKVVKKEFSKQGRIKSNGIDMPVDEKGANKGFAFIEYESADMANNAVRELNGFRLDKNHTFFVTLFEEIETYATLPDEFAPPLAGIYEEGEHLRSWLTDPFCRHQLAVSVGNKVSIERGFKDEAFERMFVREDWTDNYVRWSPLGTYLISIHAQGIALWGGQSWNRIMRFVHPGADLVDFSSSERYVVTWSRIPINMSETQRTVGFSPFGPQDEGNQIVVWDVRTGAKVRSFPHHAASAEPSEKASADSKEAFEAAASVHKMKWPVFKWSPSDRYFGRVVPGRALAIYDTVNEGLLDGKSLKIEGIVDFAWQPAPEKADASAEEMLAYWTPEVGNQPARVTLMSVPSKKIVRTKNLFQVAECTLHWHPAGDQLCVKVARANKSKKPIGTNLEIFHARQRDIPVEVIELKESVKYVSWEPSAGSNRLAVFHTTETAPVQLNAMGLAVTPTRGNVSIFAIPKDKKGSKAAVFTLVATLDKRTCNELLWSPRGRFLVLATVRTQSVWDIEFLDCDWDGQAGANTFGADNTIYAMAKREHYQMTDVEWDPTGRYLVSCASSLRQNLETSYALWDFAGTQLRKEIVPRIKQILFRPSPPSVLTEEQKRQARKTLKQYSRELEKEDKERAEKLTDEERLGLLRQLNEWDKWHNKALEGKDVQKKSVKLVTIEEWIEEVVEESITHV
ncbi:translation initiation factor eIF-3b [Ramicandelaber brevisporus]|nr:translation initiation factor eIF-3b [Ramicandelaber brevisporus]